MHSGFTGGAVPDFYSAGRSTMTNPPQPNAYRTQQLPGMFLEPSNSQIARQTPTFMGKRTLADFQAHQQNQALNSLLLRSVKPRMYQQSSPISPLSPIDFSSTMSLPSSEIHSQRLLQQVRPQSIFLNNGTNLAIPMTNLMFTGVPFMGTVNNQVTVRESEKNMINHRLQELEKQLLDDDDDGRDDEVSVITNTNSVWSETIQNLISPTQTQKPISPSPTSSTSSSSSASSSSSVASPASGCWKQLLMEAASAISEGKSETVSEVLERVSQLSKLKGHSEQRLMEYMISVLKSRVHPTENPPPVAELFTPEHSASTHLLYDLSPCFNFGFMAANSAILETLLHDGQSNCRKLHVVDFDVGQGGQYVNLLHALSARSNGKQAIVKLTTLAENGGDGRLKKVGELLFQLAKRVGISFKFNVVNQKLIELTRESLGCEPDESLAVNFAFKLYRMPDESVSTENPRDELLRRVKGLAPRVVTMVEQEINTNTAPFATRVTETCAYYGALFDSIESIVSMENSDRVRVEEGLGRKLANSVACEGRDRVERCEVFGKWRARLGMAGFELKPMSQNVAESLKSRLSSKYRVNPGFTVKEENGGISFGWMNRTLTVASAWR